MAQHTFPIRQSDKSRFFSKVERAGPLHPYNENLGKCWIWRASKHKNGYGQFSLISHQGKNVRVLAHRFSAYVAGMDIFSGGVVCHSCDRKDCVNPGHLSIGTTSSNAVDAVLRGQIRSGVATYNAKLTKEDVLKIREDKRLKKIIAEEYGVSRSHICHLQSGRFWRSAHAK